jgi:predicted DNA-binding transcriptional regulator AlpA
MHRRLLTADRFDLLTDGLRRSRRQRNLRKKYRMVTQSLVDTHSNLLSARTVRERYGVTGRTLDRWLVRASLAFPQPLRINGRKYWFETELTAWERSRLALSTPADPRAGGHHSAPGVHSST